MPTGYTADIEKGISFKEFTLRCARSFGACIMQREDGMRDLPKLQEPSDYHLNSYTKDEVELEKIEEMDENQCSFMANKEYTEAKDSNQRYVKKKRSLKLKYLEMLTKVNEWNVPTDDYIGLRTFMQEQIQKSIEWDCSAGYTPSAPVLLSGKEWKSENIKFLRDSISRQKKSHKKKVERTNERNKWITGLYCSLNGRV